MLGNKVPSKQFKQSVVSDANKDDKLIENHINKFFFPKWPQATATLDYSCL